MKQLITFLLCLLPLVSFSQTTYIGFDDTAHLGQVYIDTNYSRNDWQIGKPNKTVFTSALTLPNVMITDTSHPYRAGDTSVFMLKVPLGVYCYIYDTLAWLYDFQFYYQLNIDSDAHARIDMSVNKGRSWVNTHDSLIHGFTWRGTPARLDTSTGSWTAFGLGCYFFPPHDTDTVYFRFTFITDSGATGHDGWMIDNINIFYWCEGAVHSVQKSDLISVYPNPSDGHMRLHFYEPPMQKGTVYIRDMMGRQWYSITGIDQDINIDPHLSPGVYLLEFVNELQKLTKKIIVQ